MTLRFRLIAALVALSAVGLCVFGVVTFGLYQRSLLAQLDNQLDALARPQAQRMTALVAAGVVTDTCATHIVQFDRPRRGARAGSAPGQGLDAFTELYVSGTLVGCVPAISTTGRPGVSGDLAVTDRPRHLTLGSVGGDGQWRVLATPVDTPASAASPVPSDAVVVVAVPTAGVDEAMSRLVHIELAAGIGLLIALAVGAWVILRRGLRPLEQMSASAATITAGDLSQRVEPVDEHTEVGRLGLALNTMLDGIEGAFTQREATERRLRQFLADASHELRTPLTSIQGFAELYRLGAGGGQVPDLPVIMGRIESEAARMRALVDDLFLLAELDRVRPVRTDPVDVSVLAADACTDAVAMAPDRRVVLDAPAPVTVRGDADHLRQAIVNLVSNAIRHTPAGTPIEVATRSVEGWAQVAVRDHGPGLDEVGLAHAFDRFWQADPARVGASSGLGLSIVAGIAAEHAGTVSVENAPDGGARFTIRLPVGR
jgi:two-component system OmpR family sensor kinase